MTQAVPTSTEPATPDAPSRSEYPHAGVMVTGDDGEDGPKAFWIQIEAKPGRGDDVVAMLRDIYGCVLGEPATRPWFAVRYSSTTFGIFEAFPDIAGRNAHVAGGGGDIFRDTARMNDLLAAPAHVRRVDILLHKPEAEPGGDTATTVEDGTP